MVLNNETLTSKTAKYMLDNLMKLYTEIITQNKYKMFYSACIQPGSSISNSYERPSQPHVASSWNQITA